MSVYTRFVPEDIVGASQATVTTGLWTGETGSLGSQSLFLYDTQLEKSGEYYFDVYDTDPNTGASTEDTAEVQFAVAYGHVNGGGAPTLADRDQAKLPTKAIYSQYRNLLLNDPIDTKFTFNGIESDHIYVINFNRARYKEQLDPGNWELPLSGANGLFTLIDNSADTTQTITAAGRAGRVYTVISGSISGTSGVVTGSNTFEGRGFGLVYPDLGIIVLNPDAVAPMVGFFTEGTDPETATTTDVGSAMSGSQTASIYTLNNISGEGITTGSALPFAPLTASISQSAWGASDKSAFNHAGLFVSMKRAVLGGQLEFKARSAETISSTHYFVRLRNSQYNYSNNPTFRNPDDNTLVQPTFRTDPKTYITTVGLYNDRSELLAVAKLSKPVRKSYSEEVLLRVRLDF